MRSLPNVRVSVKFNSFIDKNKKREAKEELMLFKEDYNKIKDKFSDLKTVLDQALEQRLSG